MSHVQTQHQPVDDEYVRLPGLFRRWELEQVVGVGAEYHLEEAGSSDGTPLFAVYRRDRSDGVPEQVE